MNCWKTLGIEPSADKKQIKIAYSKLLKTTRPDDDPEGFQQLHSAYKLALDTVDSTNTTATQSKTEQLKSSLVDTLDAHTGIDTVNTSKPLVDIFDDMSINASSDPEQDMPSDELEDEWHHFSSLVNEIMEDQRKANEVNSWERVVKSPLMTDLRFKDRASNYVFEAISKMNAVALGNDAMYVEANTLNHLNAYFSWGVNWGQLEENFSSSRLDAVLPFLDEDEVHEIPKEAQPHIYSKIVNHATSVFAIIAGYFYINLFIAITALAIPSTINRIYTRKWQTKNYGRVVGGEDDQIEKNKYLFYPIQFVAMWISLLVGYGIGWIIHYLVNLVSS